MKLNKILGIIWILIALCLLGLLIGGIKNSKNRNFGKVSIVNTFDRETYVNKNPDEINEGYSIFLFNAEEISELNFNAVSEKICIIPSSESNEIKVMISNNIDVKKYFQVFKTGNKLIVERKSNINFNLNILNFSKSEVIIEVPDTMFDQAVINNVSGKIEISNLKARHISVNNVSGKIEISDCEGKLNTESVSGKTQISLNKLKNDMTCESVSGNIEINIPKDSDFIGKFETVSGAVKTDFNKAGKKEGTILSGNRTYDLQIETVSGSIEIKSL